MTNNEDVIKYLSSPQSIMSFMENSKEHWSIKDNQSRYIYMNKSLLTDVNASKNIKVEGKLDKEIPLKINQELWSEFVEHDQKVINENRSISAIEIHYYGKGNIDTPTPHFSEKMPLYDDSNKIIGTVCHAKIIDAPTLLYYMNRLNRETIQFNAPNDTFTKRELEVIFWAQQRLTAKEIAKRLDICPSTIDSHIKSIYRKADINSNAQLIEYCKHKGLDAYIPANFISKDVQLIA